MRIKPEVTGIILSICFVLLHFGSSSAYDDETVHPAINENAGRQSYVNNYIINNLGHSEGIEKNFSGSRVWRWLRQGGTDEDTYVRPARHFHDPTKAWFEAGIVPAVYSSALVWAQKEQQLSETYSWPAARQYFYEALTTGAEESFADTFLALGHLMHLVSDMAVPAHVRSDPHLTLTPDFTNPIEDPDPYETWTAIADNFNSINISTVVVPDIAIFSSAVSTGQDYELSPIPISALWDQNVYNGDNPNVTLSSDVGLAEYTNANFFSKDSFFNYSYPDAGRDALMHVNWHDPEVVEAEDGKADIRVYLYGDAGSRYIRKAGASIITLDSIDKNFTNPKLNLPWEIDDKVNEDYASLLIPAAVGYSTALLDYFFRGDIDMIPGPSGIGYALVNKSDEDMDGTFELYYDDINGVRKKHTEWRDTFVAANSTKDIAGFSQPSDVAQPAQYMLVFRGQMGDETDAVFGRTTRILPPTVIVIQLNGNLYTPNGSNLGSGESTPIYLVWDVYNSSPLAVRKFNGGVWGYPLSENEFYGQFVLDLEAMNGKSVSFSATEALLSRDIDGKVQTKMRDGETQYVQTSIRASVCDQNLKVDVNKVLGTVHYQGVWGPDLDAANSAARAELIQYINEHKIISYSNNFSEPGGYAVNNVGVTDTWVEEQSTSYYYENGLQTFWTSGECDTLLSGISDCYKDGFLIGPGEVTETANGSETLSFNAPVGGVSDDFYLGYVDALTVLPSPAVTDSAILRVNNNSGASDVVVGSALNYSGDLSYSYGRISSVVEEETTDSNAIWSSTTATGHGLVTTISGSIFNIAQDYSEIASLWTTHPRMGTYYWFPEYDAVRSVQYVKTQLDISSAFDIEDTFQAIIIIETVASGEGSTTLVPPPSPSGTCLWPTESEPLYGKLATSYYTEVICSSVDNADIMNPWTLPENLNLKGELDGMISVYVINNPPNDNNFWKFSTNLYKVMW